MSKKINNVKEELDNTKLSAAALALYLDVNEGSVSKWKSNIEEPAIKTLDQIGEILEVENAKLLRSNNRSKTGLADALQEEYKQLIKKGVQKKIESKDLKGKKIMINNPEFVKALQEFVAKYKTKNQ
ncbi:MAG: hypothetical protein LBV59_02875 [Sphingobacterium sp.]|jgi:transcriptional regulator with XRE-family HTH domain|uniref:hypothetical protein n=1 Tax=Sphingobacterium sp. TaxID=341027 RepID=UPI002840DD6C|nr:hypothetical protein [Sphingobacterium sp.]MDR3006848.1 hypothetical protein [Sphingobacterium sp.]